MVEIRVATSNDAMLFQSSEGVFDDDPDPELVAEFLADPRHHIVLALDPEIIGFVSGMHYIHPDKPVEFWINEVSTHEGHRRRGIATAMMNATLDLARSLGCREAWVVADPTPMAVKFYQSMDANQTGSNLAMFTYDLGD